MRELRDCDFCGEGPAGAFELLSPDLEPTPAEQRRVVLCDDCKVLLGDLMEPLLARAGADAGEAASNPDAQEDGGRRAPSAGTGRPSDDGASRVPEEEATESPDPLGGTTIDPGDGPGAEPADTTEPATADESASGGDSPTADESADSDADDGPGPAPPAYGKVLRLLRNRELPMARSDVEALASGAYELEPHEVEAVIDHAIDRGELVESGDQLRRP